MYGSGYIHRGTAYVWRYRINGVGMTEEQIRSIYEDFHENKSSGNHIGIRNIYRRLSLYYHNDLKFEFYNMDPGLKIFISLPGGDDDNEIYNGNR